MSLYRVDFRVTLMVVAENETTAINAGQRFAHAEAANSGFELDGVNEIERIEDLPDDWRDSLPWVAGGARGVIFPESTCSQLLSEDE